jgi:polyphosphate kinase 2 (PPK2 family)
MFVPSEMLSTVNLDQEYFTRCWKHFPMSGRGPYFARMVWYTTFHHETLSSAIDRYGNRSRGFLGTIDVQLGNQGVDYLIGDLVT